MAVNTSPAKQLHGSHIIRKPQMSAVKFSLAAELLSLHVGCVYVVN